MLGFVKRLFIELPYSLNLHVLHCAVTFTVDHKTTLQLNINW
jgi:hypothetical protein